MKKSHLTKVFLTAIYIISLYGCSNDKPILKSEKFTWYANRIEQNGFTAKATSPTHIISDYKSPKSDEPHRLLEFKFSINGKDNEMISGINHEFVCMSAESETPVITFGKQLKAENKDHGDEAMDHNTVLKIRLDMNEMLEAFKADGFYTTATGSTIYKEDFKGVWVLGGITPLIWDFDNITGSQNLQLHDENNDGIYEITLKFNEPAEFKPAEWNIKNDLSAYPILQTPGILENAIYNMALDEMVNAIEPDSTLRTGAEWAGVWTRDVSYSIILSMAHMQTEVSKNSLLRKVNSRMRIIQDTGTGGAWPCSTDRMIWTVAAWEVFLVTGDMEWLEMVYPIVCNSIEDDRMVAYNAEMGMMMGESSFIDWREQSYPQWMQPADIYRSICLGTNAVHIKSLEIASEMAEMLGDAETHDKYKAWAEEIKKNLNEKLFIEEKGYYATYLYGRNSYIRENRSESLGEALTILWDIAPLDRQQTISEKIPFVEFGAPIFYPYIENTPSYHNNAVWPFVSSYCALAYAKARNESGVLHSFATIYRAAALFCTNKENFEATSGDHRYTQVNSSNMLWSLSGNIALTHRILFGMNFEKDALHFEPFVPKAMAGIRKLNNVKYRNAILNITLEGSGSEIASFTVDGVKTAPVIPATTEGEHNIVICLEQGRHETQKINKVTDMFAPKTVQNITVDCDNLNWNADKEVKTYYIYLNGQQIADVKNTPKDTKHSFKLSNIGYGDIQIRGWNKKQGTSFASEPIRQYCNVKTYEAENFHTASSIPVKGFNGKGFVALTDNLGQKIRIRIRIDEPGLYAIDARYANGNGPTNTNNSCAMRSLLIDNEYAGSLVMPQRGTMEWNNWGWSNPIISNLDKGVHELVIEYRQFNFNMNIIVNNALLDQIRVTKLE